MNVIPTICRNCSCQGCYSASPQPSPRKNPLIIDSDPTIGSSGPRVAFFLHHSGVLGACTRKAMYSFISPLRFGHTPFRPSDRRHYICVIYWLWLSQHFSPSASSQQTSTRDNETAIVLAASKFAGPHRVSSISSWTWNDEKTFGSRRLSWVVRSSACDICKKDALVSVLFFVRNGSRVSTEHLIP